MNRREFLQTRQVLSVTPDRDRTLWMAVRQALLLIVDAIERAWELPRTSEARKAQRSTRKE